jgi:hypothetical protein
MKATTDLKLGIVIGLIIAALALVLAIFLWQIMLIPAMPVSAPAAGSQTQTDVQAQVDQLSSRVGKLEKDQAFNLRDIAWRMDQKLLILSGIALAISAVATFLGVNTYKDLDEKIRAKVDSTLLKELYQLDPTFLVIRLREGRGLEKVRERLKLFGLQNLSGYGGFSDGHAKALLQGVTVVPIESAEDEKEFREFLKAYEGQLDPTRAAFILYAPGYSVSKETLGAYPNLVTANMPATVASMVLVVGRGLKAPK